MSVSLRFCFLQSFQPRSDFSVPEQTEMKGNLKPPASFSAVMPRKDCPPLGVVAASCSWVLAAFLPHVFLRLGRL